MYLTSNLTIPINVIASQRCRHIRDLFNQTIVELKLLQRIKYYHRSCDERLDLSCFYDHIHMCLCNEKRHAICFEFNHQMSYDCHGVNYCQNEARCFQDNATCLTTSMCVCPECYYGTRCQFTTKGIRFSLDAILGYHIRPYTSFIQQSLVIHISGIGILILLIVSLINGSFFLLTFKAKNLREIGCGWYLLVLSIISLITMIISNRSLIFVQCLIIDFLLQVSLRFTDWLSSCASMERAVTIVKGIHFNKEKSKQAARWMLIGLSILIIGTTIHDLINRYLLDDIEEQRIWCLVKYSGYLQMIDLTLNICHRHVPTPILASNNWC